MTSVNLAADVLPATYDRIHLSANASEAVENDVVVAVLYAQEQSHDVSHTSDLVNKRIATAMKSIKKQRTIKVQTLNYRTSPVYRSGKSSGLWQVQQAIRLESKDSRSLSTLLGKLQDALALRSMSYELSVSQQRRVEERLTKKAIAFFKERADLVTQAWGRTRYRLVEMQVSGSGGTPGRPLHRATEMNLARSAPTIEGAIIESGV